jgi:hypothetical protein
MNRFARTALMASVLVMPLAACSSWDPTDLFDNSFFNPKKPLPGDRKPLFPEGTPGVPQGVPADLYKGYQAPAAQNGQDDLNNGKNSLASTQSTQPPGRSPDAPEEEPKTKPKPKPKPKVAAAPPPRATPTAITVGPGQSAAPPGSASPFPPPPQPQGQAPNPGASQSIWPDPPAPGANGR